MGRRSRHSAKTGDQSLYKNRNTTNNQNDDDDSDNDPMYDEVDRYNNKLQEEENYLQLDISDKDSSSEEEEDDGITTKREGVFDLGMDDDEGDSSSDDSSEDDDDRQTKQKDIEQAASSSDSSDNSDSEQEDDKTSKLFNWGTTKSSYYHGDTADLEIGQSVNDAYLEEEAGREVELARLDELDDMDFMLDGDDDDDGNGDIEEGSVEKVSSKKRKSKSTSKTTSKPTAADTTTTLITKKKQTSTSKKKLSTKEKLKILKSQHPELLPLIQHFNDPINELNETTLLACGALLKGGVCKGKKEAEVRSFVLLYILCFLFGYG